MTAHRCDAVVVLARGAGRRMGGPKFGLKLPGDSRTFLERIIDLYDAAGWPVTAVVGPGQGTNAVCPGRGIRILEGPDGGDTALTMVMAWKADVLAFAPPTHWWAHPVDLPLVAPETIEHLASVSLGRPRAIVRPVFEGAIGHPVVLPRSVLQGLAGNPAFHDGPLRRYLDRLAGQESDREIVLENVSDQGVVRDFDDPVDLETWKGSEWPVEDHDG
jgi:CTP:molybdopterin cytidylyltransferase MocA